MNASTGPGPDDRLIITGWSAVSGAGIGHAPLGELVWAAAAPVAPAGQPAPASLFDDPLPGVAAPVLTDFDVRRELGRKGTSFYDRCTALAVVACGAALQDAGLGDPGPDGRVRTGLVLGTTTGSFRSTSDYSRDTLIQEKPYLVNPVLFPNSVMNCAAGQAAIRHGLRGVNSTVAGGALAFHQALRYASNVLERGYADVMLVGAVEEFSPHRAWHTERSAARRRISGPPGPAGEGAAVFVLERAGDSTRAPRAELLATTTGFGWGDAADAALAGCVRRALDSAGIPAEAVMLVLTGEAGEHDRSEYRTVTATLGRTPARAVVSERIGECDAATGALALGALLARPGDRPGPEIALLTARTPDGGVGAALIRVRS